MFIGTTGIINNSFHFNPSFQTGFGFAQVTFQVFSGPNGTGEIVFEQGVAYPTILPVVRVAPLIQGRSIRLLLDGHEDPNCGGFSELLVVALDL